MTGRGAASPVPVVFFGSGGFAVPILDTLAAMPAVRLAGVVSAPDRPGGRGHMTAPPVAERARALGLPLLQPSRLRDPAALRAVRDLVPGVAVLADYGRLVPPPMLVVPVRGFLNLHPSLLPRHRGATPIQATILAGDGAAGVTLFEMDPGLDTGPIVAQVAWPLDGTETAPELEAVAAGRAASLLRDTLQRWLAGDLPARPQPAEAMTLTRPLTREDGRLAPDRSAAELVRRVRAFTPWPGTFIQSAGGRLAVLRADATASLLTDVPGRLVADGDGLALTTADGRLRLIEVRPASGRTMTAADLRRGRPGLVGTGVVTSGTIPGS